MISLAKLSIRRPKLALGGWLVIAIVLITIGFGVSRTMSPSITVVSGTQSAHAQQLADRAFGPSQLVPILLEGPKAQLDRVGPRLVLALNKRGHTRLLSANMRELGVGVGVSALLTALLVRPVLLPAAEVVLGRLGWWPTHGPRAPEEPPPRLSTRRLPRAPLARSSVRPRPPQRRPGAAQH